MEKVIDIEERIPSMREKRRRKTNRKFIIVLTIFVIALLSILYFQSPLSRIDKIIVNGFKLNHEQFYIEESGLKSDSSLWGFSAKDIEESLENVEGVKDVTVTRKWMRDVEVNVSEWKIIAYVENRGQYRLLLENGEIFTSELQLLEEEAPILNGFNRERDRKKMSTQLIKMDKDVYPLISEILLTGTKEDPETITVYMDDGFEVRAVMSTFAKKLAYYPDITAQLHGYEKGVIDMEVGAFFTPFSKIYSSGKEADEVDEEDE